MPETLNRINKTYIQFMGQAMNAYKFQYVLK